MQNFSMSHRSDYFNIHDKAYRRLRADGKSSWSENFGLADALLQEFESSGFNVEHSRVFQYASGWQMLEAVLTLRL